MLPLWWLPRLMVTAICQSGNNSTWASALSILCGATVAIDIASSNEDQGQRFPSDSHFLDHDSSIVGASAAFDASLTWHIMSEVCKLSRLSTFKVGSNRCLWFKSDWSWYRVNVLWSSSSGNSLLLWRRSRWCITCSKSSPNIASLRKHRTSTPFWRKICTHDFKLHILCSPYSFFVDVIMSMVPPARILYMGLAQALPTHLVHLSHSKLKEWWSRLGHRIRSWVFEMWLDSHLYVLLPLHNVYEAFPHIGGTRDPPAQITRCVSSIRWPRYPDKKIAGVSISGEMLLSEEYEGGGWAGQQE